METVGAGLAFVKPTISFQSTTQGLPPPASTSSEQYERPLKVVTKDIPFHVLDDILLRQQKRKYEAIEQQQQQQPNTTENPPPREEKNRTKRRGVWTIESHLGLFQSSVRYVESFDRNYPPVVHPAILSEDNISSFLREGSTMEPTALLLQTSLAMAIGAAIEGDLETEIIYWARSRSLAGELFDTRDYYVAQALVPMAIYVMQFRGEKEQAIYYLVLCQTICEHIGYTNSDVYHRASAILAFNENPTTETLERFHNRITESRKKPRQYPSDVASIQANLMAKKSLKPTRKQPSKTVLLGLADSAQEYEKYAFSQMVYDMWADVLMNITLCLSLVKLKGKEKALPILTVLLQQFHNLYGGYEQVDIGRIKPAHTLMSKLFFTGMLAEIFYRFDQEEMAITMATEFVREARNPGFSTNISAMPFFGFGVIWVLLQTKNIRLAEELLEILRPLQRMRKPFARLFPSIEEDIIRARKTMQEEWNRQTLLMHGNVVSKVLSLAKAKKKT